MFIRFSSALVGATMLLATPAFAQVEPVSIEVSIVDLDLASDAGRAQLDRRIRHAADEICDPSGRDLAARAAYQTCRSETLAAASRQVARLTGKAEGVRLARNAR